MARPHIEFIQSQVLPFRHGLYGGARPEVEVRTLSIDLDQGDSSTQIKWPAGFRRAEPEYLDVDEEFLVLQGELEINGRAFRKHDYAHLPRGYLRNSQSSARGAVTLTFFSGEPKAYTSDRAGNNFDPKRCVEHLDTRAHPSMTNVGEAFNTPNWDPTGTFHKDLFTDPYTGERTWIIGMAPHWSTGLCEVHPVVEEEYSILGDLSFPMGNFRDGAYFWRPPGIQHGPFATWGGTLHITRCKGGPFATKWFDSGGAEWFPEYRPILPPEYHEYVRKAGGADREPNY